MGSVACDLLLLTTLAGGGFVFRGVVGTLKSAGCDRHPCDGYPLSYVRSTFQITHNSPGLGLLFDPEGELVCAALES